jgi:hypothetical protein
MNARSIALFALAALASAGVVAQAEPGNGPGQHPSGGVAKLRPGRGKGFLAPPVTDPPADPAPDDRGVITTRRFPQHHKQPGRQWLRFKLRHLDAGAAYTIWVVLEDDPLTVDVVEAPYQLGDPVTMNDDGNANRFLDTKRGDVFDLASLIGKTVEVHDANGVVVLTGAVPDFKQFK